MDLYIKYDNGSMAIHLDAFLDYRSIGKVKKLVKLIQQSYTPDALDDLKEFVKQEIEQFELRMKEDTNYYVGYKSKLKFNEQQLEKCMHYRDWYKHSEDEWKHYNELVKEFRQEIKETKLQMKQRKSDFDTCVKNKAFCEKVLETIS